MRKNLIKRQNWKEKFYEWKQSKKSIRRWCNEQNIPCSTFKYWKDLFSNEKNTFSKTAFTKISLEKTSIEEISSEIKLEYKGISIYLSKDVNIKTFQKIIRSLSC